MVDVTSTVWAEVTFEKVTLYVRKAAASGAPVSGTESTVTPVTLYPVRLEKATLWV